MKRKGLKYRYKILYPLKDLPSCTPAVLCKYFVDKAAEHDLGIGKHLVEPLKK